MTRTALVTGANRGIGFAVASALARRNDVKLLAATRREEDARLAAETIGQGAVGVGLDLSEPLKAAHAAKKIEADHGPVDILVNNAGVLDPGNILDISLETMASSMSVNALSPLALIQAFGAGMVQRGWGRIVNLSLGWGSFEDGLSGPFAYSVSKATLNAITLAAAQPLGRSVKVNAVCPGWVRSRMGGQAASRSPEEGADTAVWLATLPDDGPTGGFWRDRRLIEW